MINKNLTQNNFDVIEVDTGAQAKDEVLKLIPQGSEVMTMSSVTLDTVGLTQILNSDNYRSVRKALSLMDRSSQGRAMQNLSSTPEYVIGSVQALTQEGQLVMASATGSQIPAYAYGSSKVIFVVSQKKIVADLNQAFKRIYDEILPLESERAKKAYGVPGSAVNKLLVINNEVIPHRVTIILVKEDLGY